LTSVGRVEEAGRIAKERFKTDRRVGAAGCVRTERLITQERVEVADVAAFLTNRLRCRRQRKPGERQCDENWQNCCVFGLSQRIHGSSFLVPRYVDSAIRGSGRGEEPSGEMSSA
jgi:hypothetical protein